MDTETLKTAVISHNSIPGEEFIERDIFDKVKDSGENPFIIIINGIRRCGKSTLMQQIRRINKENRYYLNFDDERLIGFSIDDFQKVHEIYVELYGLENTFYFDEIQNIDKWETFVRRMHDSKNKVYITGSNASMLSRELGTRLTGRHLSYTLYPFSFREYLRFNNISVSKDDFYLTEPRSIIKKHFNQYLTTGGIPEYLMYGNTDYLKSLYESIIYRDVIARYNLPDEKTLKDLIHYLASNIGREFSFNSLRKMLGLSNATTVKEYLNYFENSFLVFTIPRYSPSLKKQMYSNKKVYFIDNGLANNISFRFSGNRGGMLENIVFLSLKRKDCQIYFHKDKKECDFVIKDGFEIREAIQVTQNIEDSVTRKREIEGLKEAMDEYELKEGLILTEYTEEEIVLQDKRTIIVKPIWKWLLEG
ncbi:ATP-binding protein [uncultured Methanolobus sp.]|uniref:ATP-binding protein n=1 Tax=uncultured Methanolobus sp. TaxID=218300 RepID=UPI002AAC0BF4|nr:ATP-binding protein [uncultured Methanolobus sp.]